MDMERKFGQMAPRMKENIKMEKKMGKELTYGLIKLFLKENSIKISYKEKET